MRVGDLSGSMILVSLLREVTFRVTIPSVELAGQCGQGLNILDNAGLFAMVADSNTCPT